MRTVETVERAQAPLLHRALQDIAARFRSGAAIAPAPRGSAPCA
jgi:hypothetical protein